MSKSGEVIIVGGGIIGCAIAYELAKAGVRVTVVEQGALASEASGASGGLISPPKQTPYGNAQAQLETRSYKRYPTLVEELRELTERDVEYREGGRLSVALTAAEAASLQALLAWQNQFGFTIEWLDSAATRALAPVVAPNCLGASWCSDARTVRSAQMTLALADAAVHYGATILPDTPVTGFSTAGSRVTGVETPTGPLYADMTVIATGAWTAQLGAMLNLHFPVRPVRGQILALGDLPQPLTQTIAGAGGFLIPRADGAVLAAATVEDVGFAKSVTPAGIQWLAMLIDQLAPSYSMARVIDSWSGLRPAASDEGPLLGLAPGYSNLWVAAAHMRDGILWAPVTGELLASSLQAGAPDPLLAPYDPGRFV